MTTEARTHHWHEWDLETLLERKRSTGLTASLVVPARNEAATVSRAPGSRAVQLSGRRSSS